MVAFSENTRGTTIEYVSPMLRLARTCADVSMRSLPRSLRGFAIPFEQPQSFERSREWIAVRCSGSSSIQRQFRSTPLINSTDPTNPSNKLSSLRDSLTRWHPASSRSSMKCRRRSGYCQKPSAEIGDNGLARFERSMFGPAIRYALMISAHLRLRSVVVIDTTSSPGDLVRRSQR